MTLLIGVFVILGVIGLLWLLSAAIDLAEAINNDEVP